jgi:hypothetical protein
MPTLMMVEGSPAVHFPRSCQCPECVGEASS